MLAVWGKEYTGNFKQKISLCKREIRCWKQGRDSISIQRFCKAELKLSETLNQQEIFWRQQSKQLWLREGDSNSKFFHAKATARKNHNTISRLQDDSGSWVTWDDKLPDVILGYFQNLFTSSASQFSPVIDVIPSTITLAHNQQLLDPVTEEEVRRALFHMHPDKSLDPDGMTPGFFQKYWNVVKNDVVMQKIISKVIANRLKVVLPNVISPTQSAFIPGRLISDNIMIAFEVMHYLKRKRKGKEGYMALKLDLRKAYDRVEWGFLRAMMERMGSLLVSWTLFWLRLTQKGYSSRGSFIFLSFLICAEGFTSLIKKFEGDGLLKGCNVANGAPVISHMLFADDSYVYCRANEREASNCWVLCPK
ncbi:hypothetical protein CsatB_019075 [Cannabis sativa]